MKIIKPNDKLKYLVEEGKKLRKIKQEKQAEIDKSKGKSSHKAARYCLLCTTEQRSVLFLPCGHFAVCGNCAESLSKCPCRDCDEKVIRRIEGITFA